MRTIAHVTHEAVHKVGGIGAVIEGLLTSDAYRKGKHRTVIIGPMFASKGTADGRLGPAGKVLYSSIDGVYQHPVSEALNGVCNDLNVDIVYGNRTIINPHNGVRVNPETVLIDVSRIDPGKVNACKSMLWQRYGIDSTRYEEIWDYDLYVRLAFPALAVLHALGAADTGDRCVVLAHEYMGMPTALAAKMDPSNAFRSVFYAHEVSTIRRIVEEHPGHDVTFYNILSSALEGGRYIENIFGPQDHYYRHALVKASRHCDKIFAVGDNVAKELRFLGPEFADVPIHTTYNGIPVERITLAQKHTSRELLRDYVETLLGYRPDYIFTHVTRTAVSKGLWRDIRVLEFLEQEFRSKGKSGVLLVLSTEIGRRQPEDIREMERWWRWPVAHREIAPDLSDGEALFYQGVQEFNARSRQIKIVFVNQFGWDRVVCGKRMPTEMELMDMRRGSDVEFGQSIYEPYGIAQLEPLTFGGICAMSRVCGCAGFLDKVTAGREAPNIVVADYVNLGLGPWDERELLDLGRDQRSRHEAKVAEQVAGQLIDLLPTDDAAIEALMKSGYELANKMSWEVAAGEYIMPPVKELFRKSRAAGVA
ncbi:MAG: hypothetical protein JSV03_02130 [Planctomycetota bacterium]|nr:MAG: hypothetical protein JSV03_02130 [Planctomycetota bacterium]